MTSIFLRLARPLRRSFWTRLRIVLSSRGHGAFEGDYATWLGSRAQLTDEDLRYMETQPDTWTRQPRVLVFAEPELLPGELAALKQNLQRQPYPHWKLLTVAPQQAVEVLGAMEREPRDLVIFASRGMVFPQRALFCFAAAFARKRAPLVAYGDEDRINSQGLRTRPQFKPDWSPESFEHRDYISSSCAISADWLAGRKPGTLLAQVLAKLVTQDNVAAPRHIPQVLVSRLEPSTTTEAAEAKRPPRKLSESPPSVTILIPTRDRPADLKTCVESLLELTEYANFTVRIIDNGSALPETKALLSELAAHKKVKVISDPQPFNFAAINNLAAKQASGELLCFLNDDTRIHQGDWLGQLVLLATKEAVGAVGPMLLYPDHSIQHAGVFIGTGPLGLAGHLHRGRDPKDPELAGYVDRVQNVSAVTGACLVVRRSTFDQVEGFDERLSVCYNDVDLCLRISALGLRNVWTPLSALYHNENVSAVVERSEAAESRYWLEAGIFEERWRDRLKCDPGFHPNLALLGEQLQLADKPRTSLRAATKF
ncbi:MAG: GT2 family glycosyltransferase [Planctomycetota bacterium]|jgi:GT2 family glycosyltransferase